MDIRTDIQSCYQNACLRTGDRARAYSAAADRFVDLAGYVPEAAMLDRLLQGAVLGRNHSLMQLLKAPLPLARD